MRRNCSWLLKDVQNVGQSWWRVHDYLFLCKNKECLRCHISFHTFRCWMVSVILSEKNYIVWEWAADQLKKWTEILLANTDNSWTGYCRRTPTIHERKYCWRTPTIHERRYCWQTMTIHKRRYCWRTPVELLLLFSLNA